MYYPCLIQIVTWGSFLKTSTFLQGEQRLSKFNQMIGLSTCLMAELNNLGRIIDRIIYCHILGGFYVLVNSYISVDMFP